MKNINELEISQHKQYLFTDFTGDFDIKVPTVNGWVDLMGGYDVYPLDNGSLICFDGVSLFGFHDIKLFQGNEERHIETIVYEELKNSFDHSNATGFVFYVFTKSEEMNILSLFNPNTTIWGKSVDESTYSRCDMGKYGAKPFEIGEVGYDITKVYNVINYSGIGHIVRMETRDSSHKNIGHHSSYMAAETLEGVLKVVYEWSIVAKPPFNNQEQPASVALKIINDTDLSSNLINKIVENQPDMGLSKYIKTGENIGATHNENKEITQELKDFLMSKCTYRSLSSLSKNNPLRPSIPEELLYKEKIEAEEIVLQFCLLNNINFENISLSDLKEKVLNEKSLNSINSNITIIDAIERILYS